MIFTFLKAESIHYEINFGSDEETFFGQLESKLAIITESLFAESGPGVKR